MNRKTGAKTPETPFSPRGVKPGSAIKPTGSIGSSNSGVGNHSISSISNSSSGGSGVKAAVVSKVKNVRKNLNQALRPNSGASVESLTASSKDNLTKDTGKEKVKDNVKS